MWITASLFSIALLWQCTEGIMGVLDPSTTNNVGIGDTAIFTCTVTERNRMTQTLLWQLSYRYRFAPIQRLHFPANITRNIDETELTTPWTHGQYAVSYSEEYDAEILQLRISNATNGDSNFDFTCVYRTGSFSSITYTFNPPIGLKVWTYPRCSLSGDVPSVISFNETLRIFMKCSCTDPLTLSWFTVNDGIKSDLHGESTSSSNLFQDITAYDQGRKYICEATIADDPKFRLTCSIVPYNPRLVVSIISHMSRVDTKDIFVLVCINTGTFSPETKFLWFYNSSMILDDLEDERIQITQTETNSTLVLGTTYLPPGNNTEV